MPRFFLILLMVFSFTFLNTGCNEHADGHVDVSDRPNTTWLLTSSFPRSLDSFWERIDAFADKSKVLSNSSLIIKSYQPGELVPPLEVFESVSEGHVQVGVTAGSYYKGKGSVFVLETGIPFGMTARQKNAWLYEGGGLELLQGIYKKHNIKYFPIGNTGTQMGGWFKNEIKNLEDIQGITVRAAGLAGDVYSELGATIQMVSSSEIYTSLEQGVLDGAEFIGPYDDEKLGLNEVAQYYYGPGWGEPGSTIALYINLDAWNELPNSTKSMIESLAAESNIRMLATYDAENALAATRLADSGVQFRNFPDDVMNAAKEANDQVLTRLMNDPDFKMIYDSMAEFQSKSDFWLRSNELLLQK